MKDILVNVLFMLVILFITQILFEGQIKKLSKESRTFVVFLLSVVSIFFCMTFSISLNEQFHYDIRAVPFILGSLIGGPIVSVGLYLSILIFRLLQGLDLGFFGAAINNGLLAVLLFFFSKRFIASGTKQKVLLSIYITVFHLLLSCIVYSYVFISYLPVSIFLQSSIIKLASITLIILISEKIRQNHQLRIKMEDIEKMELVSHLSASISHEVRNGLTGASGFMQLLRNIETDTQKRQYIHIALDELERTEHIIRDFLTYAKPAPEEMKDINIELLIDNTLEIIMPLANMNSVEIHKHLSPFLIKGDERKIQQSLLNIIKNAIEAMPNGGRLEIHIINNQNEHIIAVKDTGIGMTPEQMERLGRPYFTTKGQKGTGLGMMVSYRVIEELNGQIRVHSQVGKGTTLTIHLPRTIGKQNTHGFAPQPPLENTAV